jgi:hypothetical protein
MRLPACFFGKYYTQYYIDGSQKAKKMRYASPNCFFHKRLGDDYFVISRMRLSGPVHGDRRRSDHAVRARGDANAVSAGVVPAASSVLHVHPVRRRYAATYAPNQAAK